MFRRPLVVHGLLLLLMMIWGATFVAVKTLVAEIAPIPATALRFSLASVALLALLPLLPRPRLAAGDLWRVAGVGLLNVACYHLALNSGVAYLPAGIASLVIATSPTFTAALAALLLREPLRPRKLVGIALAFVGLAVVALLGSAAEGDSGRVRLLGVGITLLAPLSLAGATVFSKPLLARFHPITMMAYVNLFGALFLVPLVPSLAGSLGQLSAWGWLCAFYLALLGTVLGYIIWFNGLRSLSATGTAIYLNLVPLFGLLSAWLLLGEQITIFLLLGGGLIITGVLLTNLSDTRAAPRQRRAARSEALNQ